MSEVVTALTILARHATAASKGCNFASHVDPYPLLHHCGPQCPCLSYRGNVKKRVIACGRSGVKKGRAWTARSRYRDRSIILCFRLLRPGCIRDIRSAKMLSLSASHHEVSWVLEISMLTGLCTRMT
ncbi:hypothetical protein BKA82DRAFT_994323 [Pisolithus tinctorius]|uniref:Uncharacterized protein n=1 Tax=Pisolithus tinctorius Marx 270 TaxID=870435 RepID=A0A0C3PSE8_PISTI|nr:hypothetical protein BKA82DRAFT_994323 [Pisolithus tinctorius]KIO11574.1 hypothetical protein M404DRAFT_994323 [Pisolithus tinctorius Marx 270]